MSTKIIPHNKIEGDLCVVPGCDRPRASLGRGRRRSICGAHYGRKATTGDIRADIPIREHVPWNDVTVWCDYRTAHRRVSNARGPAVEFDCIDCGQPAEEWSYGGQGRYEFTGPHQRGSGIRAWSGDPADYEPRCRDCHRTFDNPVP